MTFSEGTLRFHVEKWFGRGANPSLRINRVWHSRLGRNQCVRVVLLRTDNPVILFFFRHGDGSWSVFPPEIKRASRTISSG